jgi:hypothetical protein
MKFLIPSVALVIIIAVACNKDKFQTKPTIKFKELNATSIPFNGSFIFTLEATDKEGDVQDSVIIIKKRLNKRVAARTLRDTLRFRFPEFPKSQRTLIQATLDYTSLISAETPPFIPNSNPLQKEPDTLQFRLAVRDKAGNTSDTIESPVIYVFRQ